MPASVLAPSDYAGYIVSQSLFQSGNDSVSPTIPTELERYVRQMFGPLGEEGQREFGKAEY